ncbi:MAG: hypothetical protein ACO1NX_00370 [Chitinophagaceae bacterium]
MDKNSCPQRRFAAQFFPIHSLVAAMVLLKGNKKKPMQQWNENQQLVGKPFIVKP